VWHQIHELAKIVDRLAVDGTTADRLATALHGLPSAQKQNVQRDLHLLARWLHVVTQKPIGERPAYRTFVGELQPMRKAETLVGRREETGAEEMALSLSALDDDGSPVVGGRP
jgi:hypothetical protein